MRLYRCLGCRVGFAVFLKRGRENKSGKGITCPLCKAENVEEVDVVREAGATLAAKALDFWLKLPSGD